MRARMINYYCFKGPKMGKHERHLANCQPTCKQRSKSTNISCLNIDGSQISDSSKIANSMTDCSIGNDPTR